MKNQLSEVPSISVKRMKNKKGLSKEVGKQLSDASATKEKEELNKLNKKEKGLCCKKIQK